MALTPQQLNFLKKYFNFNKQNSLDKSTEEAANAVFGEAQPAPGASVSSPDRLMEEAANAAFGESQASPYDPLQFRAINDRMKQVAKMKFPTALDRQKAHSLQEAKGLVDSGKLDEANKLLDALEAAVPQLQAINDRMKQVAKMKFPTALDSEKDHWLEYMKGLVDDGKLDKLDKAEKSLERWEDLASQVGAGALQGEQYVMKSMGEIHIQGEKNKPSNKIEIGGIEHDIRPTALGGHVTPYMTPEQTKASEVKVDGSGTEIKLKQQGKEVTDSVAGTKLTQQGKAVTGENIFVMDGEGKIMAQSMKSFKGNSDVEMDITPHHSNFLRGEDVAGAGELHTDDQGNLKKVTDQSGHYRPDDVQTQQVLESLKEQGANLDNVKFRASKTKTEGMATEFQQGVTVEQFKKRHDVVDELKGKFQDDQNKATYGRTTYFRWFGFDIEYPVVLTNKSWQKKKSLKDKANTKTGLGTKLTVAEKDWADIRWDMLHPKMSTDTSIINDPSALAKTKEKAEPEKGRLEGMVNKLTWAGDRAKEIVDKGKVSKDTRAAATEIEHAAYGLAALLRQYSVEKAYDNAIKAAERRKR